MELPSVVDKVKQTVLAQERLIMRLCRISLFPKAPIQRRHAQTVVVVHILLGLFTPILNRHPDTATVK